MPRTRSQYGRVPEDAGRQSGSPADVAEVNLQKYLTQDELDNMSATDAFREAHKRRDDEFHRRANEGTGPTWDSDGDGKSAMQLLIQPIADLMHSPRELGQLMTQLWWTHRLAGIMHACVFIALLVHMAVYHWAEGHSIGQFPLVTDFIHDDGTGHPIIEQHDVANIGFWFVLIEIPFFGMIYHGGITWRPRHFDVYFFDNIIHHIGSLKYLYYAMAYAFVTFNVFALVGNSNIIMLVLAWAAGGAAYLALHSASYQGGKALKNYTESVVAARASASEAFENVFGVSRNRDDEGMHAGAEGDGEFIGDAVAATVQLPVSIAEGTIEAAASLLPHAVTDVSNAVVDAITPPDTIMSPYGVAGIVAGVLHAIVLVCFVEACHNSSIRALPWIAVFAFFWYFLPTTAEIIMHILYFQRVGLFQLYAYKEMTSTAVHTAILSTFVLIIYFFSVQYGTIYV